MAQRLAAQLLAGPKATSVLGVLERCVAVQSQELRAGHLGVRARSTGLSVADVYAALADRSAIVTWVNRGTLHLIRSQDYAWLHAVTTPQLAMSNATRLRQEGVSSEDSERAMPVIRRLLSDGPATRAELRDALQRKGIPVAGQAVVHLLLKATLAGICVRGPMVGREQAFVLVADWLGKQPRISRSAALRELGVRYLAGHGPSTDRDLAKWAGLGLRDARTALEGLVPPTYDAPMPGPTLLGPWDELLLGWESRTDVLAGNTSVVTLNGIFKPIALVCGRAVATWAIATGALEPFAPLSTAVTRALEREYADVQRFLAGRR
ncbi:MAG: winged helix DNA-binding domain-containing protein [Mycobacteriales bacterium]